MVTRALMGLKQTPQVKGQGALIQRTEFQLTEPKLICLLFLVSELLVTLDQWDQSHQLTAGNSALNSNFSKHHWIRPGPERFYTFNFFLISSSFQ